MTKSPTIRDFAGVILVRQSNRSGDFAERINPKPANSWKELRLPAQSLSSRRLSASPLHRSATPLAAIGIACLGFVPTLGGPEQPLHWAMTAGMVGFGGLLLVRHRLRGQEPELARVEGDRAKQAGRAIVIIAAILTLMVLSIVVARLVSGGAIALLSLLMPAVGLAWLGWIGWRSLRDRNAASDAQLPDADRPSRRPPDWQTRPSGRAASRAGSDRHASA